MSTPIYWPISGTAVIHLGFKYHPGLHFPACFVTALHLQCGEGVATTAFPSLPHGPRVGDFKDSDSISQSASGIKSHTVKRLSPWTLFPGMHLPAACTAQGCSSCDYISEAHLKACCCCREVNV